MAEEKKYIADNGKTLTAYKYTKGLEDGICEKHNKPYISQQGRKIYLSEGDYVFAMDGGLEISTSAPEIFEKYTKLLD